MKKFPVKAITVALASVCGSAAFAGVITAPTTSTKYAVEALTNTQDISLPAVAIQMGIARTAAQDFTIVVTPSAGAKFTAGSCASAIPVLSLNGAGTGAATSTVKRASADECAYEVDVTTAFSVPSGVVNGVATNGVTLTMTGLVLDSHTLATAGNTAGVTLNLWDLGETARIDTTGPLSATAALSGNALTLTAAADTATKADVNDEQGPLFGFVTIGDDVDAVAKASFVIGNNSGATTWLLPDGATAWDFTANGTAIAVSIAGNFQGAAAANGVTATTTVGTAPTVTYGASNATATFSIAPTNVTAGQTNTTATVTFTSARTASLGTGRTFGVSAVGDVVTGADVVLAGNGSWWTWGANAIQLSAPWISNDQGPAANTVFSRYFFQNLGPAATYSAACQAEAGKTVTAGAASTGTLVAGQTVLDALAVCSFSTGARGSVTFTINAPVGNIKGLFKQDLNGASSTVVPLERPYAGGTF